MLALWPIYGRIRRISMGANRGVRSALIYSRSHQETKILQLADDSKNILSQLETGTAALAYLQITKIPQVELTYLFLLALRSWVQRVLVCTLHGQIAQDAIC